MTGEALFFKKLWLAFLAFFIISLVFCLTFVFLSLFTDRPRWEHVPLIFWAPPVLSLIVSLLFLPAIVTSAIADFLIKRYSIKSLVIFCVMNLYLFMLMLSDYRGEWYSSDFFDDERLAMFIVSSVATLVFCGLVIYLNDYKKINQRLFKK